MFSSDQEPGTERAGSPLPRQQKVPAPHHGQTHSCAIRRGEGVEGGTDILLNKHRISLSSRKAPLVALFCIQETTKYLTGNLEGSLTYFVLV